MHELSLLSPISSLLAPSASLKATELMPQYLLVEHLQQVHDEVQTRTAGAGLSALRSREVCGLTEVIWVEHIMPYLDAIEVLRLRLVSSVFYSFLLSLC